MSTIHRIWENGCETVQRFQKYKPLIPIREAGGIVYVSGHGPEDINTYEPLCRGRIGEELTPEEGYQAAAECAKTLLRAVQERYGSLDCIRHMVRALALVNCGRGLFGYLYGNFTGTRPACPDCDGNAKYAEPQYPGGGGDDICTFGQISGQKAL